MFTQQRFWVALLLVVSSLLAITPSVRSQEYHLNDAEEDTTPEESAELNRKILTVDTQELFSDKEVVKLENRGLALIKQGRWDEGLELMKQAVEMDPIIAIRHLNYGTMLMEKGISLSEQGYKDEAKEILKDAEKVLLLAIELFRDEEHFADERYKIIKSNTYFLLGEIYFYPFADKDKAKVFYENALELYPKHPGALSAMKNFTDSN